MKRLADLPGRCKHRTRECEPKAKRPRTGNEEILSAITGSTCVAGSIDSPTGSAILSGLARENGDGREAFKATLNHSREFFESHSLLLDRCFDCKTLACGLKMGF